MKTAIQIFLKQTQRGTKRLALQLVLLCAVVAATLLLSLSACGKKQPEHIHKWDAANCTRGELCWGCYETRGEALGHDWADATCIKAKHCTLCGITEGDAVGHVPQDGSCSRCGETLKTVAYLDAMGHVPSHQKSYIVYNGVQLEFSLMGDGGTYSGLPVDYIIYDENMNEVTAGQFPKNPPYVLGQDEFGKWIYNRCLQTEFIPLSPGSYTVEYQYYSGLTSSTYPHTTLESVYIPSGPLKTGICELVVK